MEEKNDIKNRFFESNKNLIELFNELHKEYDSLKKEKESLISMKGTSSLEINPKFGIVNLAKLNEEAIFDAINYFNKTCPYCKTDLYAGNIRKKIEIDHFFPIAKGGQDLPWNLLPICKDCNRKKKDRFPFDFIDESTYIECYNYLESVLFRLTNSHEDKLQRDEITYNLLMNLDSKKLTIDKFITELYMLFNIPITSNEIIQLDLNSVINEIIMNKEYLFGGNNKTYTTEKKIAEYLYKNKPTMDQKNLVRQAMRELFNDCRMKSNKSYYTIIGCRDKLNSIEELSELNTNKE